MTLRALAEAGASWIGSPSRVMTTIDLVDRLNSGLPLEAADELAAAVAPDDRGFKYNLVSKATYARRRLQAGGGAALMSKEESERLARLARVWAFACEVWGGEEAARRFLRDPHPMLAGKTPLSIVLDGETGGRLVEEVLGRLAYGSAA